jgi:hypothetical protein
VRVSSIRRPSSAKSLGSSGRKLSLASFKGVATAVDNATAVGDGEGVSHVDAVETEMRKISIQSESVKSGLGVSVKSGLGSLRSEESRISEGAGDALAQEEEKGNAAAAAEEEEEEEERPRVVEDDNGISRPTHMTQGIHVVYNEELAHYEGLPSGAEWKVMNKQFGIPIGAVPKRTVEGYEERVPAVLEMMRNYLVSNEGHDVVGIFRLAPDRDDCLWAKQQINEGEFNGCGDVNIIANLIKVFFRELPVSLLDRFDDAQICKVAEMQVGQAVLDFVEEVVKKDGDTAGKQNHALVMWLFDLMSKVVMNEGVNKMSAKNMAIVMSPNLYSVATENPMVALTMSQKVADFCTVLLKSRLKVKWGYDCK